MLTEAYSVLAQLAIGALVDTDTVTVTPPGTLTSAQGATVSQQLSATSSTGAAITNWTATGLPPGLSIDAKTGTISGTPTSAGTFTVTVTATDTVGPSNHDSGQAAFTWIVTGAPPASTRQPLKSTSSAARPWPGTPLPSSSTTRRSI